MRQLVLLLVAIATLCLTSCGNDEPQVTNQAKWEQFPLSSQWIEGVWYSSDYITSMSRYQIEVPAQGGEYRFSIENETGKVYMHTNALVMYPVADDFNQFDSDNDYFTVTSLTDGVATGTQEGDTFVFNFKPNTTGQSRTVIVNWDKTGSWLISDAFVFEQAAQ